jgi:hypothetical protein
MIEYLDHFRNWKISTKLHIKTLKMSGKNMFENTLLNISRLTIFPWICVRLSVAQRKSIALFEYLSLNVCQIYQYFMTNFFAWQLLPTCLIFAYI